MGYCQLFQRQIAREYLLQVRQPRLIVNTCLFFIMVMVFFPLTMPSDNALLRVIAPGLFWIAALFAFFLSAERLFQQDYEDGVIEQWLVSGNPMGIMVAAKLMMHWLLNLLPILLFCPAMAVLFGLKTYETEVLMLSFMCGTPAMLCFCALSAAFSTGLRQKGMLMGLILFPLTIPIMIFGSASLLAAAQGAVVRGYLALLLAISVVTAGLLIHAIAAIIRIGLSD